MRSILFASLLFALATAVQAERVLFQNLPDPAGGIVRASWWWEDGSDWDKYSFDNFILQADSDITAVEWIGGGAPVYDFQVTFYNSLAGGSQPICGNPEFHETIFIQNHVLGTNAGESYYGTLGGVPMYSYRFDLPSPLHLLGNTHYWIKIEGFTHSMPNWGLAKAAGLGSHFYYITGEHMFRSGGYGNETFTLLGTSGRLVTGTVVLNDTVASPEGETVTWELLNGSGAVVEQGNTTLLAGGNYSIDVSPTAGTYNLRLKGRTWLSQLNAGLNLGANVTNNNYSLVNGDVDGDNEVGPGDFGALSSAFGSVSGDANWDFNADLDGDGEVGPSDFGILSAHFGEAGS